MTNTAGRLHFAAGGGDDVLHDRKTEARAPRGAGPVAAVETLEEPREVDLVDSTPVVGGLEHAGPRRQGERRAGPRVANRVLRQVLGDDLQHPAAHRQLDRRIGFDPNRQIRPLRAVGQPVSNLLEDRQRACRAECDDLASALELGEEKHVVDELAHLLDLVTRLGKQCLTVGVRQRRGLEQREQPRERRAQLVGHCCCEADSKLLVGPCLLHQTRVWPRS